MRERFPAVRLIEQENLGLAAGLERAASAPRRGRWVLILNADAWLVGDALERLVAVGDAHPDVAVVGPRLLEPGRDAAAVGARLPDPLAARHRVPLPAQARAGHASC